MREQAIFRPFAGDANPRGVCCFLSEVFAELDVRPRAVEVEIDFSEASVGKPVVIDFERGEPLFRQDGCNAAHGMFNGRWLAEHDVPVALSPGKTLFLLRPTSGNRIRVRLKRWNVV